MPSPPPDAPQIQFRPLRINAPGYGPKIVPSPGTVDLSAATCLFPGAGAPAAATLPAGNGKYIINDLYVDTTANAMYRCTAAGTNATSTWVKISGGGASTFRGAWIDPAVSNAPYNAFDEVLIRTGIAAGCYVSTIDNNPNDPATGIGWMQKSPGTTEGSWT